MSPDRDGLPRVFSLEAEALGRIRSRVRGGEPSLLPAVRALLEEADLALLQGPWSVTQKNSLPPSGDKHDYQSYGPYWWPDPDRPDGLPYVRRDGETNPEARDSARSDRLALGNMVSAVETLSLAYYLTADERYAERAVLLLRTWFVDPDTRMNPHLRFGQAIPGRVQGRGIGIIDTHSLINVVDAIGLLGGSPHWTEADSQALTQWYDAYLDWLLESDLGKDEKAQQNNHGSWYDAQVVAYALLVGKTTLAKQVTQDSRASRIASQIQPDGRQPRELARTKAFGYSLFNLEALFTLAMLAEKVGVDLWHYKPQGAGYLKGALDFMLPWADPQTEWPYPQIVPESRTRLLPLLLQGYRAYGDERYIRAIETLDQDQVRTHRAWLKYEPRPGHTSLATQGSNKEHR